MGGFAGGVGLGFAARWGRFCTLNAIETSVLGRDHSGLRMWGLAIAIAVFGSYGLDQAGLIDLSSSFYVASPTTIFASIVGGLLFGLGMAFVGTCGYGTLARLGGGDLKSLVTFLVMGITAYATLRGITAYVRMPLFGSPEQREAPASLAHTLHSALGSTPHFWAYALAGILLLAAIAKASFLRDWKKIATGLLVGLIVVWGWIATGIFAGDEFEPYPLESYTFSAPLGDTIMYGMTTTGASLKFGIGATLGVIAGAAITSLFQGHFRWEACDDAREMRRQVSGGLLMGFGSVTALGCTIGQGISAASLLAWSAPITLASIFAGAWLGLHMLVQGSFTQAVQMLFQTNQSKT